MHQLIFHNKSRNMNESSKPSHLEFMMTLSMILIHILALQSVQSTHLECKASMFNIL